VTVLWKRVVVGLCSVAALWSVCVARVSADAITVTQQIVVHATVLSARYIIVSTDKPDTVNAILSNTAEAVEPAVYIGAISGRQIPFTQTLRTQYEAILRLHPDFAAGEIHPSSDSERHGLLSKNEFTKCNYNVTYGSEKGIGSVPFVYNASGSKRQRGFERQKMITNRIGIGQLAAVQTVQNNVGYYILGRIANDLGNL